MSPGSLFSALRQARGGDRTTVFLRASVSIVIIAAVVWWLSPSTLLGAMGRIPPVIWALVTAGFLLGHALSALKWRLLLRAVGVNVPARAALRAHGAGLFANLCLPSLIGGDLVRAGIVMRSHRSYEHVALGSIADRVNDTLALLLLATLGATLAPVELPPAAQSALRAVAVTLLAGVLGAWLLVRYFPAGRLPTRLEQPLERIRDGLHLLQRAPRHAALAFGLSLLVQGSFVWLNVVLARAMGIDAPAEAWLFAWPLAKLAALAPVSLGGIGVREVAIAALMAPLGIDAAAVLSQSLSWEVVLIAAGIVAGLLALLTPAPPAPGNSEAAR